MDGQMSGGDERGAKLSPDDARWCLATGGRPADDRRWRDANPAPSAVGEEDW